MRQIRNDLPSFLRPSFPHRLFLGQLVSGSDQYISLTVHEGFHPYQGMMTPQKFSVAELINQYADQCPWSDESLQADWQAEPDLLANAHHSTDSTRTTTALFAAVSSKSSADNHPTDQRIQRTLDQQ